MKRLGKSIWLRTALIFFVISAFIFSLVFTMFYRVSTKTMLNEVTENAANSLVPIVEGIDSKISMLNLSLNAILSREGILYDDMENIRKHFIESAEMASVFSSFIIIDGDEAYSYSKDYWRKVPYADQYKAMAKENRTVFTGPYYSRVSSYRCMAYIRSVMNPGTGKQRIFAAEVSVSRLLDTFTRLESGDETLVVLTSDGRTVYFQVGTQMLKKVAGTDGLLDIDPDQRRSLTALKPGTSEIDFGGNSIIVQKVYMNNYGWYIYGLHSNEQFYKTMYALRADYRTISILGVFLIIGSGIILSYSVQRPVRRIANTMDSISEDKMPYPKDAAREDEIGRLWRSFYEMMDRLRESHETHIRVEKEKSYLEYRMLQNQIKPHFLFNMHLCVRSLIECGKMQEAREMLGNMDSLLMVSMDDREVIALDEELDILQNYVNLQKSRMGHGFEFVLVNQVISDGIIVPKLLLQPVVENALRHGIADDPENGEISVELSEEKGVLTILVSDNGKGIPKERLDAINEGKESKKGGMVSIGLKNIRDRIRLYYGDEYGLTITSHPGMGTQVKIMIPVQTADN